MEYIAKILQNKRTKQLFIALNKRQLEVLKHKIPKQVIIKKMKFKY